MMLVVLRRLLNEIELRKEITSFTLKVGAGYLTAALILQFFHIFLIPYHTAILTCVIK